LLVVGEDADEDERRVDEELEAEELVAEMEEIS
jgi:hypothetical protein